MRNTNRASGRGSGNGSGSNKMRRLWRIGGWPRPKPAHLVQRVAQGVRRVRGHNEHLCGGAAEYGAHFL